jgi:hypothetical protein
MQDALFLRKNRTGTEEESKKRSGMGKESKEHGESSRKVQSIEQEKKKEIAGD